MWLLIILAVIWAVMIVYFYFDEKRRPSRPTTWGGIIAFGIGFAIVIMLNRFPDQTEALIAFVWP